MFSNFYPFWSLHCRSPEYWTWIHIWRHFGQLEANIYSSWGVHCSSASNSYATKKCTRINRQLCKYENYALTACLGQRLRCFFAENAEKSRQTLRFQRAYSSRMRSRNAGFELGGKKSEKRARGRVALIPLALIAHAVPNNSEINLSSILEYSIMF